jgi:hypothetical protein
MVDVEVVGCISENRDEVEALDGSVFDLEVRTGWTGAVPGEVNTKTGSSSTPSTFGGMKSSSSDPDRLSDSSKTASKSLVFLYIRGTKNSQIWEKPKPETSLYL